MKRLVTGIAILFGLGACAAQEPWRSTPRIVVVGALDDERQALVLDAVAFWNAQLREIGSGFALGMVTTSAQPVPEAALQEMSQLVLAGIAWPAKVPQVLRELPGDITVLLGDSAFISFAGPFIGRDKRVVGIRGLQHLPMSLPNVARNVIAHELGHAIGLGHGADANALMCGRPAPCRPTEFQSAVARLFPLTDDDRRALLRMYPPNWAERPP